MSLATHQKQVIGKLAAMVPIAGITASLRSVSDGLHARDHRGALVEEAARLLELPPGREADRRSIAPPPGADDQLALRLAEKIEDGALPNPFTPRIVAIKGWAGLGDVSSVRRAVAVLESWGRVTTIIKPTGPAGGRPSDRIWANPVV